MRNSTLQHDWIQLSTIINALMARTRQQDDFSTEEIAEYHDLCGDFLGKWIDLAGETKHVTNYIHIVGSGHLVHFLQEFGNLCKFSQQGWEALNQKIKKVYHNKKNHGGNVGGHTKLKQGHISRFGCSLFPGMLCGGQVLGTGFFYKSKYVQGRKC